MLCAVTEAKELRHSDKSIPATELLRAVHIRLLHLEPLDTERCILPNCTALHFFRVLLYLLGLLAVCLQFPGFSFCSANLLTNFAVQTVRHFFGDSGGSSYASFDPATELGVQDIALPRI